MYKSDIQECPGLLSMCSSSMPCQKYHPTPLNWTWLISTPFNTMLCNSTPFNSTVFNSIAIHLYGKLFLGWKSIARTIYPYCRNAITLPFLKISTQSPYMAGISSPLPVGSVSNGSIFPRWFRIQFRPGTEPLQRILPHQNPDHCNWAGFATTNPVYQHHKFGSNSVSEFWSYHKTINMRNEQYYALCHLQNSDLRFGQ